MKIWYKNNEESLTLIQLNGEQYGNLCLILIFLWNHLLSDLVCGYSQADY